MDRVKSVIDMVCSVKEQWQFTLSQMKERAEERIATLERDVAMNKKVAEQEQARARELENQVNCLHEALSCCLKQDEVIEQQKNRIEELEEGMEHASVDAKQFQRELLAMGVLLSSREQVFEKGINAVKAEKKELIARMTESDEKWRKQTDELSKQAQQSQERINELELEVRRGVGERQVDASRNRAERVALESQMLEMASQHKNELEKIKKDHEEQLARTRAALDGEVGVNEVLREKTLALEAEAKELRETVAVLKQQQKQHHTGQKRAIDSPEVIDDTSPTSSQIRHASVMEAPPLREKFPFLAQVVQIPKRATKRRRVVSNSNNVQENRTTTTVPNALDFCQVPE